MKKGLTVDDVYSIIIKHSVYHTDCLLDAHIQNNEEDMLCHSSALATLKMLKMEMDGEKEW